MPYYLDSYVGSGERLDPFRPSAFDDDPEAAAIDLRPDGSVVDGRALVFTPNSLKAMAGRVKIGDDKLTRSSALVNAVQNRLDLNLSNSSLNMAELASELLMLHGREDGTRWRNLLPSLVFGPEGQIPGVRQYEIWLGDLLYSLPVIAGGATLQETFNKANSTVLGPETSWTETVGSWEVLTNQCHLVTGGGAVGNYTRCDFNANDPDMYAQATVAATTNYDEYYLLARYAESAQDFYFFANFNDGTNTRNIRKSVAGGEGRISAIDTTHTITVGEVLRLECNGSTIKAYIGGTLILTQTDTSLTAGTRGGLGGYNSTVKFDDFEVGSFATLYRNGNNDVQASTNGTGTVSATYKRATTPKQLLWAIGCAQNVAVNVTKPVGFEEIVRFNTQDAINDNTCILWVKEAVGNETTITFTESGHTGLMELAIGEYLGFKNGPVEDQENLATHAANTPGTSLALAQLPASTQVPVVNILALLLNGSVGSRAWSGPGNLAIVTVVINGTAAELQVADATYPTLGTAPTNSSSWTTSRQAGLLQATFFDGRADSKQVIRPGMASHVMIRNRR